MSPAAWRRCSASLGVSPRGRARMPSRSGSGATVRSEPPKNFWPKRRAPSSLSSARSGTISGSGGTMTEATASARIRARPALRLGRTGTLGPSHTPVRAARRSVPPRRSGRQSRRREGARRNDARRDAGSVLHHLGVLVRRDSGGRWLRSEQRADPPTGRGMNATRPKRSKSDCFTSRSGDLVVVQRRRLSAAGAHADRIVATARRLFDVLSSRIELEIVRVVATPQATHIRYRVHR